MDESSSVRPLLSGPSPEVVALARDRTWSGRYGGERNEARPKTPTMAFATGSGRVRPSLVANRSGQDGVVTEIRAVSAEVPAEFTAWTE